MTARKALKAVEPIEELEEEVAPGTPSLYKSWQEVTELLAQRTDPTLFKTIKKGGIEQTYIAWNDSVRILDNVFGALAWDYTLGEVHGDPKLGLYWVNATITVKFTDDSGVVQSVTRMNTGRAQAVAMKSGELMHDLAIAAAASDALSRCVKLLGNAFGLFLYDKDDESHQPQAQTRTAQRTTTPAHQAPASSGDLGYRPSEKQQGVLTKEGYTPAIVANMQAKQWKAVIDAIFAHTEIPDELAVENFAPAKPTKAKAKAPVVLEEVEEDEEDDEDW